MNAERAFLRIFRYQHAFQVIGSLLLTAYLFPRQAEIQDLQEFDIIVVGGGSAGIVVAFRLAECNLKVLLIDAGGDPPIQSLLPPLFPFLHNTEYDWNYTNIQDDDRFQCQQKKTLELPSGRVLGGGSSVNYMLYVRGCPDDFRYWAEAANDSSWNYQGLLPYFIKSERLEDAEILRSRYRRFHGTKGFLGVTRDQRPETRNYLESFRELGHDIVLDINGDRSLGYTQQMFTISEGWRQSTAFTILGHYNNPNLSLLRNTFVTKILFDANNNAVGVRATTEDNRQVTLKARNEVIVSAGALSTPRLLMLSGIGPREHLESLNIPVRKDLPVGKNLHDHLPILVSFQMEQSNELPPPINYHRFAYPTFSGYVALNKFQKCPTYQASNAVIPADSITLYDFCIFFLRFDLDICDNLNLGNRYRNTMISLLSLLHPESRGQVLLRSTNAQDPPLIDVGYFKDNRDLEAIVDSVIDLVRVLNTTYFRSVNAELIDLKLQMCESLEHMSRDWWRCYVRCMQFTIYHYVGTCALGSVVDSELRVIGFGRLRVIDASVMPRVVGANTNAATIAIGEKGADIVKREHLCNVNSRRPRNNRQDY